MLRSRASLVSLLVVSTLVFSSVLLADACLEIYSASLTTYLPTGKTKVQNVRPRAEQRGVNLDGSMRAAPGIPAAIAGNPFENVWGGTRALEGVALDTGSYSPFEVDMALPAPGHRWILGRSYSARQDDGGQFDSNGPYGRDWFGSSQPELQLYNPNNNATDVLYLVYGADRYVEFNRAGSSSNDYKSKNGAAGAFTKAAGSPDIWTYTGPNGTTIKFFGGNTASNKADWQLWKILDADGNTSYVGDSSTASTAVTNGFDSGGRITTAFDSANRRYTYAYSSHNSVTRLDSVTAEILTSGTWTSSPVTATVGLVAYTYYGTGNSFGDVGALQMVTVTTPQTDTDRDDVRKKNYRYYTGDYDAGENPGYPYEIKYVIDFEGFRALDWSIGGSFTDSDVLTCSDDPEDTPNITPYAVSHFEYDTSRRIVLGIFNGSCGCGGGGANGTTLFSYGTNSSYTNNSGYDTAWARRTVVGRADGTYLTQYFDEVGQTLSQIITDANPANDPAPKDWSTKVIRDSIGCVVEIDTPASISGYDHSNGTFTVNSGVGLIRTYTRPSSTDVKGFVTDVKFQTGTSGSAYLEHSWTHDYTTATKTLTDVTIVRPLIASERVYSTPQTSGTSGSYLTSYAYTSYGGSYPLSIEKVETTYPTVSAGKNGSDAADVILPLVHLRKDGLQDFAKAADGEITYTAYTNGQVTTRIEDADTGSLSPPSGFSSLSTPPAHAALSTTMTYDNQGRRSTATQPTGRREKWTYAALSDRRLITLHYPHSTVGGTLYGPVTCETRNQAGKTTERAVGAPEDGEAVGFSTNDQIKSDESELIAAVLVAPLTHIAAQGYDAVGTHVATSRTYFLTPGSMPGAVDTNYDQTSYTYDSMARVIRTLDETGTIHKTVFDSLGRAYQKWIGTDDSGTGSDNMVKTEQLEFDDNASGGNSFLTKRTEYVEGSTTLQRVTSYTNDVRGNVLLVDNPAGPDQLFKYDNMNRQIAVGQFSSTTFSNDPTSTTTNRLALSEAAYDERGRVWKSIRHNIDVSDGSDDDSLESLSWYDATGRVIKTDGEQLTKTAYDTAGRAVVQYVLASDNDSGYSDMGDVTGDIVLEQNETAFDASGRVIVQANISRYHTDTSSPTGSLDTGLSTPSAFTLVSSPDVLGRIQISAMWYDALDRVIDTVQYGTNGGSNFSYPGSAPARSDTKLRRTSKFNDDGTLLSVTDPKGLVTGYEYDDAGRRTAVISNYVDGVPPTPYESTTEDNFVRYEYADGLMTKLWVDYNGDGTVETTTAPLDQVTTYTYGVTKGTGTGDSKISSKHLLAKVQYPESTDATNDVVKFAYNAQGQQVYKRDQATTGDTGDFNEFETVHDDAGRETARKVTHLRAIADGAVQRIATAYTALGQVDTVIQYTTPTGSTVLDGVKYLYDGWGNVTNFRQDMDSAVGSGTYYEVAYLYEKATNGRNTVRRISESLAGRFLSFDYGSLLGAPNIPEKASRLNAIVDDGTPLVKYDYLGAGQVVGTTYDEPDVFSKQYTSTAGDYADLDRFNRVTTSKWTKDLSSDVNFYNVGLTYDEDSNILSADDSVHVGFDVAYTMDNLNRLTVAEEGTLSGSSITGSPTRKQEWTLTRTGDWNLDKLDLNGDGDWSDTGEWKDRKTFNKVNEILTRDLDDNSGTGGDNYSLTYDPAGNLTNDGTTYKYEWDAFYRLARVRKLDDTLVAEYRYNGLGYRIAVHEETDGTPPVNGSDLWYYSAYDERWRMVATYRSSDSDPKEIFVHQQAGASGFGGSSYIDLVAFREKDANTAWTTASDGVLEDRLYYCQNQHADVVALITAAGGQREMDRYSAYGVPFGLPIGDCDSDGDCDVTDRNQVQAWINNSNQYDVRGDLDLDGDVDSTDKTTLRNNYEGVTLGRTVLSANAVRNGLGLGGYIAANAIGAAIPSVRHRTFSAQLGEWIGRDPKEYVEGANIYQYVSSNPLNGLDPSGLHGPYFVDYCGIMMHLCLYLHSETYRNLIKEMRANDKKAWVATGPSDMPRGETDTDDADHPSDTAAVYIGGDPENFAHEMQHSADMQKGENADDPEAKPNATQAAVKGEIKNECYDICDTPFSDWWIVTSNHVAYIEHRYPQPKDYDEARLTAGLLVIFLLMNIW